MINIIAHRGLWIDPKNKNTADAFKLALDNGFGIETDLRDFKGDIVISHDIPTDENLSFKKFMSLVRSYPKQTLALNIKSDGLQQLSKQALEHYSRYFFFDMSVPDTLGYSKNDLIFYTRYSDIELLPSLLAESAGVWLDNFSSNALDLAALNRFLNLNKKVVLVSPELHGYKYQQYWEQLLQFLKLNIDKVALIGLCTDKPIEAKEFFKNAG